MRFSRTIHILNNSLSPGILILHTAVRNKLVVPATKSPGAILNARSAARKGVGQEARNNAGTQRLQSLDYSIHPCMLPFGPAFGCSNLLLADLVQPKTCWNDGICRTAV